MHWRKTSCRLTVGFFFGLTFMVVSAFGQMPPHYYDAVEPTNAATLRQTLHDVIDDHTRFPYTSSSTDTWDILEAADQDRSNANNILDLYRNTSISKQGGGNSFYNREHSWPKSYGFPNNNSTNYPYTDCHALFLSDSGYNSSRSNKPYRSCGPGAVIGFDSYEALARERNQAFTTDIYQQLGIRDVLAIYVHVANHRGG